MQLEKRPSQQVIMLLNVKALINQYLKRLIDIEELTLPPFKVEEGEVPQWVDVLTPRRDEFDHREITRAPKRIWFCHS